MNRFAEKRLEQAIKLLDVEGYGHFLGQNILSRLEDLTDDFL